LKGVFFLKKVGISKPNALLMPTLYIFLSKEDLKKEKYLSR